MKINIFSSKLLITIPFLLLQFFAFSQDSTVNNKDTKSTGKELFGQASYYANKFEGRRTANGETFSHKKLTAACNKLPLGTWIEVTNLRNGKKVIVKTNDRLHPSMNRIVDLTMTAAIKLDFVSAGLTKVKVVVLNRKTKKRK
ncbi:MAG: septal ring lytic transglycosylase RlpA family protein [Ferruginibacter sp.]|nr:septal ring lytic transglycosylase RlpA family protein [Ferruginibacter sp.]